MRIIVIFILICNVSFSQKDYKKLYKDNILIAEGWTKKNIKHGYWVYYFFNGEIEKKGFFKNGKKTKYWYFYNQNGLKLSEGHFENDKKIKWWLFYDGNGKINHKCQLNNNIKNGYCLMYKNQKLISAVKYNNGKRIKEWTDFKSFKKENKLSDLQ